MRSLSDQIGNRDMELKVQNTHLVCENVFHCTAAGCYSISLGDLLGIYHGSALLL